MSYGLMMAGTPMRAVPLGVSPATYTNAANAPEMAFVSGGTVTTIEFGRKGTFALVGLLAGQFTLSPGDALRVTYAVAPTVSVVPM